MTDTQIGFIGLGIMGLPMALNIRKAGYPLHVYARRAKSTEAAANAGAAVYASPKLVAERSEIVFTMVSDTADVEQVILGDNGVIHGAAPGSVVVDMSTISPSATRTIAEVLDQQGIEMLDAPVSGGDIGAIAGTLSVMVGGKEAVFERVLPLFEVMGKNIVHIGDHGAGQVAKACNQVVIVQTMAAVSEAFILARESGVDPAKVRQALLGGFANSRVLEAHGQRMLERDFQPGFKLNLLKKDLRITLETASELGIALPGAALATQYINALVGSGQGDLDASAIYTALEQLSGLSARK